MKGKIYVSGYGFLPYMDKEAYLTCDVFSYVGTTSEEEGYYDIIRDNSTMEYYVTEI